MWYFVADVFGSMIGAMFWGGVAGIVMVCIYGVLLPRYVRLWNKRYPLRAWHFLLWGMAGLTIIAGSAFWGLSRGIERSGRAAGESIGDALRSSTVWVQQVDRRLAALGDAASPADRAQVYLDGAFDRLQAVHPTLSGLLESSARPEMESYLSNLETMRAAGGDAIIDAMIGYWHRLVEGWAARIRWLVVIGAGGINLLFLAGLGWAAYRDLRKNPGNSIYE